MREYYVQILASDKKGALYIGVTNDLTCRIKEHGTSVVIGITKTYGFKSLA